jgi:hypothetical protein
MLRRKLSVVPKQTEAFTFKVVLCPAAIYPAWFRTRALAGGAMKKAVIKQIEGMTFTGKSDSNHWVMMDGSLKEGGSGGGYES